MVLKDKISILISILAIVLSVLVAIRGEIRVGQESKHTIRSQLTSVLESMMDVNLKAGRITSEDSDPLYKQHALSVLNQENAFLLSQAMYLSEQIPNLVTPVELITVAYAHVQTGNQILAEDFYTRAINSSNSDYDKIMSLKTRAQYLFLNQRFNEAREDFKKSLTLMPDNNDMANWTHGTTYFQWANYENFMVKSQNRAKPLYENAKNRFQKINNQTVRALILADLENTSSMDINSYMPNELNQLLSNQRN